MDAKRSRRKITNALPAETCGYGNGPARTRVRSSGAILTCLSLLLLVLSPAFALPNGTETIITTDTAGFTDSTPVIYGDYIVCLENQNMLVMYNLASGETVALPLTDPFTYYPAQPDLSGNTVTWQEYDGTGYARIVRYDIAGGTVQDFFDAAHDPATMEFASPNTDGITLVWQNYNTTNSDWDVAVVREGSSVPELILDSANNEKHPAVWGNDVVYENWSDPDHSSVWRFNLTDNTSAPVSESSDQETFPQVSADRIVWQARDTADTVSHIDVWEDGGTVQLTPPGVSQEKPAIFENRVVVEDYRRNGVTPDVYLYEYTTSWKETYVAPNRYDAAQYTPAVWNNRVVWEDTRSGITCGGCDSDVYLFTLGTADNCPVAAFTPSENAGPDPLAVTFADQSAGSPVLYHVWNFSDGTGRYPLDPSGQTFSGAGIYHTTLTIGNTKCRNVTPALAKYDIYVDTPPGADFTATPLSGFAPLAVQFTDTSGGNPASWTWNFGDGALSHQQNPRHTFTTAGQTHTVSLTVNNTFAGMAPDTETKTDYIRTFLGATGTAAIPVQGITVVPRYGGWFLLYNATMLPDMVMPDPAVLSASRPSPGWQNITFISGDSLGFSDTFGNTTYMGNLSQVVFQTENVTATGVSPAIGTGWGVNYRFENVSFPSPASVSTAIWENTTATDRALFRSVIIGSNFIGNPDGIAYTAHITKAGIRGDGNAVISMSVDRTWTAGKEEHTYITGYGINSRGDTVGGVRPARFLSDDGTLDYFEAEVPEYFTTFGISPLSGSGNPLQLVTLSVTSRANEPPQSGGSPDSDGSGGGGKSAGQGAAIPVTATPSPAPVQTPAPPDPGKTANLYTSTAGVITQQTILTSTDGLASVVAGTGVVAKGSDGKPLLALSIRAVPRKDVPATPAGAVFSFAGMAYEIQPDGATFTPPVTLSFTIPQAAWGQEYFIKSYDAPSGTWEDHPAVFDAKTNTLTVPVSHLCIFALFSQPASAALTTPAVTPVTAVPVTPQPKAPPPPASAVSIFISMLAWTGTVIGSRIIIVAGAVLLLLAVYLYRRGRSPGA